MAIQNYHEIGTCKITCVVTGELWAQNCYLVTHKQTGEQVLIDPGYNADIIVQTIKENGSGRLNYILLTHAHFDHVGAVTPLCERFNVVAYIHKSDSRILRHAPMYALRFAQRHIPKPEPYIEFEEQPELSIEEQPIKVLHVPGHSSGSVCYCFAGFAFTGDTLLNNYVGRVDLPGCNLVMLKKSVGFLLKSLPGETVLFTGHGKPWNISEAATWWETAKHTVPQHTDFIH